MEVIMNDDLSDLIKNFSNSNINMNKISDILSNLNSSDKSSASNDSSTSTSSNSDDLHSNIDINTILKMKEIMDKINSTHNDKRSNLLLALKPYLRKSRQSKLDQYMKLLNMAPLLEIFKNNGGDDKNV